MTDDEHKQTAKTVGELGIELAGFRELVNQRFDILNANLERLATALETSNLNKADQKDLLALTTRVALNETKLSNLETRTSDLKTIRNLVYGAVGVILLAFMGGIVALVMINGGK